jgi:alkylation response protein AidB-like acyl-CoA dehydrogenase
MTYNKQNRMAIALALGIVLAVSVLAVTTLQNSAEAQGPSAPKRIVGTIVEASQPHDAEGHSAHQAVYYVRPHEGYLYDGKLTFTTSSPVDILVYHDVTGQEHTEGLTLHKVDGRTYAVTTAMKGATSGTVEFIGAGILAHKVKGEGEDSANFNTAASIFAYARMH